jgi:cytochrome c556
MNEPNYISFDSATVFETINAVNLIYADVEEIIKKINTEKNKLSTVWSSSSEAKTFETKLAKVYKDLEDFETRYNAFIDFVNQTSNIYSQSSDSIVKTINSVVNS